MFIVNVPVLSEAIISVEPSVSPSPGRASRTLGLAGRTQGDGREVAGHGADGRKLVAVRDRILIEREAGEREKDGIVDGVQGIACIVAVEAARRIDGILKLLVIGERLLKLEGHGDLRA